MPEWTICAERGGDAPAIRAVVDAAFGGPVEGQIVDDIRGTDRWIDGGSLIAVAADGTVVGQVLLSEGDLVADDGGRRRVWMVGPVAVVPPRQRQGVGSDLMRAAIALATERAQPVLLLLGHATYYPRFGFEPARSVGIEATQPWPDESWLALRLPAWDPSICGVAQFPPAFHED